MVIYGSSNIGNVRKENQDSYIFDIVNEHLSFAIVCDGMGGVSGGKTASSTAVNVLAGQFREAEYDSSPDRLSQYFGQAIDKANIEIYNKALTDTALNGMGTTLVSAVIINNNGYFLNIGDSRAYLLHDGAIRRISHDHSAVQELVDQGMLTESQARNHPNKNIITRALGVEHSVSFDSFSEPLSDGDIIVLCTDGITNYVDDLEILFEITSHENIQTVPQQLIELANSRGGADNSTVAIIKI